MKRNALAWAAIVISTAALVSSRGVTRAVPAAPQISPEGQKQARALGEAFNAVAEFVKPSVVQISVVKSLRSGIRAPQNRGPRDGVNPHEGMSPEDLFREFFGGRGRIEPQQNGGVTEGTGSGFIYDDKGHILTNNHVVEGADQIVVQFSDGEKAKATIVGTDPKSDVAVIHVEKASYPALQRGKSSKARVGDWVLAIGSPFGFEQTVTSGIISAIGRNNNHILDPRGDSYEDFLQTDAAINPGNSGGPLVDLDGKVIGINAAIATASRSNSGIGFAIPIEMAANLAERLIKDGKVTRAQIGIVLQPLTQDEIRGAGVDPKTKGVLVAEIVPGSPAEKAGLKVGDILTNFDGNPALNVPAFRNMVSTSEIGKDYALTYIRDGQEQTAKVVLVPAETLASRVGRFNRPGNREGAEKPAPTKTELENFGLEVQELTPSLAKEFGFAADAKGVVISDVAEGSSADANGLRPGMLITRAFKDRKVTNLTTPQQFQELAGKVDEIMVYAQSPEGLGRFYTLSKKVK